VKNTICHGASSQENRLKKRIEEHTMFGLYMDSQAPYRDSDAVPETTKSLASSLCRKIRLQSVHYNTELKERHNEEMNSYQIWWTNKLSSSVLLPIPNIVLGF
jgi:hypothetical protein